MKKTLLILIVAVVSLTACKKDTQDRLKGRWDLVKAYYVDRINGVVISEETESSDNSNTYIVFEGNKFIFYENGELNSRGTFTATESSITMTEEGDSPSTTPIKWNSKNEFVVISKDTETHDGNTFSYESELTFKKH